jgi:uncharacterized Zn-finger protein
MKAARDRHIQDAHKENDLACSNCGKGFHRSEDLSRHIRSVHLGNSCICPHCEKTFSRKDNMYRHVKTHHQPHMQ